MIRNYKGLKQGEMADKLKVSHSYMSEIEGKKVIPSLEVVGEIIRLVPELNMRWFMFGDGDMLNQQLLLDRDDSLNQRLTIIEKRLDALENKKSCP